MKKITVGNLNLFYCRQGEGEPILILHGWEKSATAYNKLITILAKNYQVFVPDLPGFGQSKMPPEIWGVKEYADLVANFITKLGKNRLFLIGHSFGGRIAIELSVNYPNLVKKMVLTGVPVLRSKKIKRLSFIIIAKLFKIFFILPPFCFVKNLARKFLYFLAGEKDYLLAKGKKQKILKKIVRTNQKKILGKIKCPVLLVWGESDQLTSASQAEFLDQKIPDSVLEIVLGASHKLPYEQPKLFASKIVSFLKS